MSNCVDINYGLVVMDKSYKQMYHFCAYKHEPTQVDIDAMRKELKSDPSVGLCDIIDDLVIVPATKEVIEWLNNLFIFTYTPGKISPWQMRGWELRE